MFLLKRDGKGKGLEGYPKPVTSPPPPLTRCLLRQSSSLLLWGCIGAPKAPKPSPFKIYSLKPARCHTFKEGPFAVHLFLLHTTPPLPLPLNFQPSSLYTLKPNPSSPPGAPIHPGGNPGANLKSIPHRCYL